MTLALMRLLLKGYDMFTVMESGVLTDRTTNDDDYDHTQPKTAVFILETEAETLSEDDMDHIRDYFRMRCHCAHDCCGHRNGGVSSINRMWSHRYVVVIHSSLNF